MKTVLLVCRCIDHHNDPHDSSDTKQEGKHIDAIYIEEEVNAMEYLEDDYESWLADTGASCHVTYNDDKLHNVMSNGRDKVIVGDQRPCEVPKKGNLTLISEENDKLLKYSQCTLIRPTLVLLAMECLMPLHVML